MATQQQIDEFKRRARARDIPESVILNTLAKNAQVEAKSKISNGGMSEQVPSGRGTLVNNFTGGEGVTGLVNKVGKFIAPAFRNATIDTIASNLTTSKEFAGANESVKAAQKQAQNLIKKANNTKDKELKKKYLDLARQLNNQTAAPSTAGLFSEDAEKDAASRGLAIGAEVGTLLTGPKGKGANALSRTLSAVGQGAVSSGVRTATSLEDMTPEERLNATANSALVGGALTGGFQVFGETLNKIRGGASTLENSGKVIKQDIRKIRQPGSVYGASKEKEINKVLDELGFKGTPEQQYASLEPKLNELESQLNKVIEDNPNITVKVGDIKSSFMTNLKSALRSKDLTSAQAKREIEGYINDLIKASGGKGKFADVGLQRLRDLKKLVNDDYGPVRAILDRGGTLNARQKVIEAAWESLDDAVKGASPEMKRLLKMESALYKAAPSLQSARFNPPTLRALGISIPAEVTNTAKSAVGDVLEVAGKVMNKLPESADMITEAGQRAAPVIGSQLSSGASEYSTYQPQDSYDQTQDQAGEDYSSGNMEHTESLPRHPLFGRMTKQEILLKAFKSGVSKKGLEEIEALYDKFSPEGGDGKLELTDSAIKNVADTRSAVRDVERLTTAISSSNLTGPLTGWRALNPYDTDSRELQAEIDRVRQKVGKALEGGVLRKEDEDKYKKILPTMGDTKQTALKKLEKLRITLAQDLQDYVQIQSLYGKGRSGQTELPLINQ